jgi:hypothetical protein
MNDEEIRAQCQGGMDAYDAFADLMQCLLLLDEADRVEWLDKRIEERRSLWEEEKEEDYPAVCEGTRAGRTMCRINAMETLRTLIGEAK